MNDKSIRTGLGRLTLEGAVLFAIALVFRLVAMRSAGMFDEYYHILAAQAWLSDGSFGIMDGASYDRAWAFTLLVAASMRIFGESLIAARLPSLLAGALWPVVVYVGVRRIDARIGAAAIAAGFMVFDPTLLGLSQVARFYTIHGLFFWVGVFAVLSATRRDGSRRLRILHGLIAISAFSVALHLQVITVLGFGGVVLGILLADTPWMLDRIRNLKRIRGAGATLATLLAMVFVALWLGRETVSSLWSRFNWAPLWLEQDPASARYYHWWLQVSYPLLWGLFPVAISLALLRRVRLTVVCTTAFAVVFVASSLARSQLARYMAYALPFLFVVWGLALREAIPRLAVLARGAARSLRWGDWVAGTALVAMLGFGALNTPAWWKTARALDPRHPEAPYRTSDWERATPVLKDLVEQGVVVLSSAGPQALFHLERLDFQIGANFLPGNGNGPEFATDYRIGRPVLSTVESLELVMKCFERGIVVAHDAHWRRPWSVDSAVANRLETRLQPISLPAESRLRAFSWSDRGEEAGATGCPEPMP